VDQPGDGREDHQTKKDPRIKQVRGQSGPDDVEGDQDLVQAAQPPA
jgi:hypothetical protein